MTGGGYKSRFTLTNTSLAAVSLVVDARDAAGNAFGRSAQLTLGAGETRGWELGSLLQIGPSTVGPAISGSLRIRESRNLLMHLMASLTIQGSDAQRSPVSLLQYWIREAPGQFWEVPFAAKQDNQFTALSIANPNSEAAAEAVVVVYSRGGLGLDVVSLAIPPG